MLKLQSSLESQKQKLSKISDLLQQRTSQAGITFNFFTWAYISRLLFCLLLFLVTSYCNAVSSAAAGWRTPNVQFLGLNGEVLHGTFSLPDLGHSLLGGALTFLFGKDIMEWHALPDLFVSVSVGLTLVLIVQHPKRFIILRRLLAIYSLLNLLRAYTVIVTSLPDASPVCAKQFGDPKTGLSPVNYKQRDMFPDVFYRGWLLLVEPGQHVTCGDMIFSGDPSFISCPYQFNQHQHTLKLSFLLFSFSFFLSLSLSILSSLL